MLPEGRINMTEEFMLPARPGAALVALKASVPVVPCYIRGAPYRRYPWSPLLMPARVEVRFGEPIDLSEFHGREGETGVVQEFMLRILKALARLAGRARFRAAARRPQLEADAGRAGCGDGRGGAAAGVEGSGVQEFRRDRGQVR